MPRSLTRRTPASSARHPYVLLPPRGLRSPSMAGLGKTDKAFSQALHARLNPSDPAPGSADAHTLDIVHSLGSDGPKLARLSSLELAALRSTSPGVRAIPVVYYDTTQFPRPRLRVELRERTAAAQDAPAGVPPRVVLRVEDTGGAAVPGASVIVFTNRRLGIGAQARTDARGLATLRIAPGMVDALFVYGPAGYWGHHRARMRIGAQAAVRIDKVDLQDDDFLAGLYASVPPDAGQGVVVGVIDTGVDDSHPDLVLAGSRSFVISETDEEAGGPASGEGGDHGTHVAGIIAGTGVKPAGKRGVAPCCALHSYRVFPHDGRGAANYDILRAIEQAVEDGCDLINLSLGGTEPDEAVHDAIKDAFERGTLCIAAAGNDARAPIRYPARWAETVCVGALGRKGSYPSTSSEKFDEKPPMAAFDAAVYAARFSNKGPEMNMAGPGVGIVSTLPGGLYGPMSGTSMACPAVTGVAAALLGARPDVLAMPRDARRATAALGLLNRACADLELHKDLQGIGIPLWSGNAD